MIINKELSNLTYDLINDNKQISKLGFDQNKWDRVCHTINEANKVQHGKTMLGGEPMVEYMIADIIKSMILPSYISLNSTTDYVNIKSDKYEKYEPAEHGFDANIKICTPLEFNSVMSNIYSARRKPAAKSEIKSLRDIKQISDVADQAYIEGGLVKSNDGGCFPIEVTVQLRHEDTLSEDPKKTFAKWFLSAFESIV